MGIIEVVHEHYRELGLNAGRSQGRMEGIAEGERLTKRKLVAGLLNRGGFSDSEIAELTETSVAFVEEVRSGPAQG